MNKFLNYKFYTIFLIVILLLFALATLIEWYKFYPILITKDSILYIFSLIPQVIIGLLALTLVALPYQFNLLENKVTQDEKWIDAVSESKYFIFNHFIALFLIGITIVIFSSISLGSFQYQRIQDYSFTLSTSGFLVFISYFIYLIIYSFDPNRLKKIENKYLIGQNDQIKLSTEPETQTIEAKGFDGSNLSFDLNVENKVDSEIGVFIENFARLEEKIYNLDKNLFPKLSLQNNVDFSSDTTLVKAINNLLLLGKISIEESNDINLARRFRNALIHKDPSQDVNPFLFREYDRRLDRINKKLDRII